MDPALVSRELYNTVLRAPNKTHSCGGTCSYKTLDDMKRHIEFATTVSRTLILNADTYEYIYTFDRDTVGLFQIPALIVQTTATGVIPKIDAFEIRGDDQTLFHIPFSLLQSIYNPSYYDDNNIIFKIDVSEYVDHLPLMMNRWHDISIVVTASNTSNIEKISVATEMRFLEPSQEKSYLQKNELHYPVNTFCSQFLPAHASPVGNEDVPTSVVYSVKNQINGVTNGFFLEMPDDSTIEKIDKVIIKCGDRTYLEYEKAMLPVLCNRITFNMLYVPAHQMPRTHNVFTPSYLTSAKNGIYLNNDIVFEVHVSRSRVQAEKIKIHCLVETAVMFKTVCGNADESAS
jgi:hypothetical protein